MAVLLVMTVWAAARAATPPADMALIDAEIAAHPGQTGATLLDTGESALRARAWLADHARHSIEVQYFIWSSDNVGILAAEALLRAAERGVRVRVLVDDLLIDAPDKTLLALARHPNVDIRIYNPRHKVGTPLHTRLLNVITDFRGVNQRMHDKTFIVDGRVGITGGRNMADEYFDYDRDYAFRDRDVLLLGESVKTMRANFDAFWTSPLAVPVEARFDGLGLMKKHVKVDADEVQQVYRELHAYAARPENFAPEVRAAIAATPESFARLARDMAWGPVEFIHDTPGKNGNRWSLGGGGTSGAALAQLVAGAKESILIQSPYLVLSDRAKALFRAAVARGVKVRILTNSLASTDNLQAFSGYRKQRRALLKMGLDIREFKPDPASRAALMSRANAPARPPVFALHAKSMVVDGKVAFVGTFNFDPRSENLNTEVGAIIRHEGLARQLQEIMETDLRPENSWRAADEPDQYVPLTRRGQVRLWQLLPLKPVL
ncbi:MAG: phospholipase D family protein [Thiobacillus sp.]|nr:phospholipase D family protein [Thiobacillus sp.]